ncbi:MAG: type II secretion system protein [Kiritimatiellae bacterium]|nr:type II secretion system protein [Kiritimatiellia bacterium]
MKRAFTLVELLVVMTIIAILAGIMYPVIQDVIAKGRMTETLKQGQSLYQSLLAAQVEKGSILPRSSGSHTFATSTDYFIWAVTNQVVDVTFDFFSAHGLPACAGLDPATFTAEHNAWCIVADVNDGTRNMTPVLFTRNLAINSLGDPLDGALTADSPFGKRGVIVILQGGSGKMIPADKLELMFNPAKATNPVLRP